MKVVARSAILSATLSVIMLPAVLLFEVARFITQEQSATLSEILSAVMLQILGLVPVLIMLMAAQFTIGIKSVILLAILPGIMLSALILLPMAVRLIIMEQSAILPAISSAIMLKVLLQKEKRTVVRFIPREK